MIQALLVLTLAAHPVATPADSSRVCVRCPAYHGDPPWRPITCYILSRMGIPPDRAPQQHR